VLALTESSGNAGSISGAQRDLANLFTLLSRDGEALTHARAGTEAARRAGISTLLAMMLRNEAALALRCGEVGTAQHAADEALQIAEPGRIHDATRGQSLVIRARCLLARGDLEHAQMDLEAASPLLDGHSPSGIAAGAIAAQASWWETNAELLERHERLDEALNAWSEAITRRRHVSQLPQVEGPYTLAALTRTLENQAQTLRRAGDSSGANEALAEARALRNQIGLPR
jgi:tetratricopeptide (TPR) repeat protein